MESDNVLSFTYRFVFQNRSEKVITLDLDKSNLTIIMDKEFEKSGWTKSDGFSCRTSDCGNENDGHCPVALIISRFIKLFGNLTSYERVLVHVESEQRTYSKETSMQEAIGSMLGIIMPTSGCPILGKLKPLVRFHLPFASIKETEFRVFSMYLLAQYLRMKQGLEPDWEMTELKKLYENVQTINKNVAQKIADLEKMDTSINSLIVLNNYADSVTFSLEENLIDFEKLFDCWLNQ